jgi:hypothetical protein
MVRAYPRPPEARKQLGSQEAVDRRHSATYGNSVSRKKISTTVYITPEQNHLLKQLSDRTKVPVAEYIRQGIDLILAKNKDQLPGQVELFAEAD